MREKERGRETERYASIRTEKEAQVWQRNRKRLRKAKIQRGMQIYIQTE